VSTVEFAQVSAALLARSCPWRTFRWRHSQLHYSGWYWSATTGGHVVYESRLELGRLLLADFDPAVIAIAAQPFCVTVERAGRVTRYVPDFLLIDANEAVTVVNVKPAYLVNEPRVAESLAWAGEMFAQRGWCHEVWSGVSPVVLANVRFLAAYRYPGRVQAGLVAAVAETVTGPVLLRTVEDGWPQRRGEVRAAVLHLVWRGVFRVDLEAVLSDDMVLTPATGQPVAA
jgi:hypothetical protein